MESTPEPNNALDKEFYKTSEAARILGITQDTILRWIRQGRVKTKQLISGQYRLSKAEVERLKGYGDIPACKLEAPPPAEIPAEKPKEEVKDMAKKDEKTVVEPETPPKTKEETPEESDEQTDEDEDELE